MKSQSSCLKELFQALHSSLFVRLMPRTLQISYYHVNRKDIRESSNFMPI